MLVEARIMYFGQLLGIMNLHYGLISSTWEAALLVHVYSFARAIGMAAFQGIWLLQSLSNLAVQCLSGTAQLFPTIQGMPPKLKLLLPSFFPLALL